MQIVLSGLSLNISCLFGINANEQNSYNLEFLEANIKAQGISAFQLQSF